MATFKIEIRELLSRIIEVESEDIDEAIQKANELYTNESIVLDYDDLVSADIEEYKQETI